jgi:hypothetical protein
MPIFYQAQLQLHSKSISVFMFLCGSVALNILRRQKVEDCIFLNHPNPHVVQGTCTILQKEDDMLLCLIAAITCINYGCSQLLGLGVLLDTYRSFHDYLLPCWLQIYSIHLAMQLLHF